mgnify:CR=1 FL=1
MCGRSVRVLFAMAAISLAAAQVQGSPYDRVAYWDSNFGTAWAGDGIAVRDALVAAGYRVVNGTELKAWMDARIADKKLSVVVMCRDAAPNTVAEAQNATCTIRRYLEAGGKVVWYSDIPFYYVSAPGGANTTWGDNGSINVLGFAGSSATRDVGAAVTITEDGKRWGLKTVWNSTRPTGATITPNLTILATDRNGAASGWVKHYVPGDTFRGFVRIEDHTGAPASVANLIAVAEYYEAFTTASQPVPEDGATDIPRDVVLGWAGTDYAATHNVYFGTSFADVNTATAASPLLISQGKADTTCDPDGLLEYGQTYYWRVDEVNAAPDNTVFKGEVWSFTVEPFAYPIKNITASASGVSRTDTSAQNTVNGSGLNASDQHSVELTQMWMSNDESPKWIQYEFDKVYTLDELWVWNANQIIEGFVGFGARNVVIEYSVDGQTWTALEGVPEFARASGTATYVANTVVDFGGVQAKYVKLNIETNWGGMAKQVSLSEVRFYYVPVQAFMPVPANGATNVPLTASLDWRPGREATSHKVFFGADSAAVAGGTAPASTVAEHGYTPAAMNLDTEYSWRVDSIGDTGTYEGDLWSFRTQEYLVVDDFEGYTDDEGSRIYEAWVDGITTGASGSQVGYDQAPFAETTNTHGGNQSMPILYDNSKFALAEAQITFDSAQNWTARGIKTLAIQFAGAAGNTGQLYVKINSTKVAYNGAAADLTRAVWQAWNIDLSTVGNVSSVRTLTIGIEGTGAAGKLYIDDIRLYPKAPQFITPVNPGNANLVGLWTLDGNTNDTSGKGNNGTVTGGTASWVPGAVGQAMEFTNGQTFIDCGKNASLNLTDAITITAWIKMGFTAGDRKIAANQDGTTGGYKMGLFTTNKVEFEIRTSANAATLNRNSAGGAVLQQDVWYHVAGVYSKGQFIRTYVYGNLDREMATTALLGASTGSFKLGCGESTTSYFWLGALDDVRVYNRVLSQEELLYVMGQTQPVAKPF